VSAMVFMAWIFGWLAGAGLPPTATYIIGAVVIVRPLQELGINPWVAHFFVFLLSVWGELSPPTSLTAAVSARIANASFLRTMYEALKICAPITFMTFAIFARSEMVVSPGWAQVVATVLVLIATSGVTVAMFGRFATRSASDIALRCALAAVSFVVMLHPSQTVALITAVAVVPFSLIGIWRHRALASPKIAAQMDPAAAQAEGLDQHAAAAKRHGLEHILELLFGAPGETKDTVRETIEFVKQINPHTIQVALPAALPGTYLYDQAKREGWLRDESGELVGQNGFQVTSIEYPHLSHRDIFEMQEQLYRQFFFRPSKIAEIMWEMLKSPTVMQRRLREGVEFFQFLRTRKNRPASEAVRSSR